MKEDFCRIDGDPGTNRCGEKWNDICVVFFVDNCRYDNSYDGSRDGRAEHGNKLKHLCEKWRSETQEKVCDERVESVDS